MSERNLEILKSLYIWQVSIAISVVLLTLGFIGRIPYTDIELIEGKSIAAIIIGMGFFAGGAFLRYYQPKGQENGD